MDDGITSLSFQDLKGKLNSGELTVKEVLLAYQAAALAKNKEFNFIAQPIDDAEVNFFPSPTYSLSLDKFISSAVLIHAGD